MQSIHLHVGTNRLDIIINLSIRRDTSRTLSSKLLILRTYEPIVKWMDGWKEGCCYIYRPSKMHTQAVES